MLCSLITDNFLSFKVMNGNHLPLNVLEFSDIDELSAQYE